MATILQDLRYGFRLLLKNRSASIVAVLTMALGIGANSAVFSLVDGILISPLPYSEPAGLVQVSGSLPKGGFVYARGQAQSVDLAAHGMKSGFNLTGDGAAERLDGVSVSAEFFNVLGARAAQGRVFQNGDDVFGNDRVVVLSDALWRQRFGGDPSIIGKSIVLDDTAREVVGVMPSEFRFPAPDVKVWVPLRLNPASPGDYWGVGFVRPVGRLRAGFNVAQAGAEFRLLAPQIRSMFPWRMPDAWGAGLTAIPLQESLTTDVQPRLLLLAGAVALVLLIACVNVANVLLGSSAARQREIAIRVALGAARLRLVRQLLTESILVALAGAAVGLLLATQALALLKTVLPADTPRLTEVQLDVRILLFTAGLAIVTGLVFGLLPALRASRPIQSSKGAPRNRVSSILVVAEVAVSLVLVIGAGLLVRTLEELSRVNPGFRTDHLLTARITPGESACRQPIDCNPFYAELLRRLKTIPGVQYAAGTQSLPLDEVYPIALATETHPVAPGELPYEAWNYVVTPGYFQTMSIPVLRGSEFTDADTAESPRVVLVSARMAEYFWPGQDPIGKRVKRSWENTWHSVIGVAGNSQSRPMTDASSEDDRHVGEIYFVRAQASFDRPMSVVIRTEKDPLLIAGEVQSVTAGVHANVPVSKLRSMEEIASASLAAPRSLTWLLTTFAVLALALGSVGIYGVISYSVAERTTEIGVRVALGAERAGILRMVVGYAMKLTSAGVLLGFVAAMGFTRLLSAFLYAVEPTDAAAFITAVVVLSGSALLASYIPARRATRIDPLIALRRE